MVDLTQAVVTVTHLRCCCCHRCCTTHHPSLLGTCMFSCDCSEGRASMRTCSDMLRSTHSYPPKAGSSSSSSSSSSNSGCGGGSSPPTSTSSAASHSAPYFCSSLWRAAILALQNLAAFTCCSFGARFNFYLLQVWGAERQSFPLLFSRASHTRSMRTGITPRVRRVRALYYTFFSGLRHIRETSANTKASCRYT